MRSARPRTFCAGVFVQSLREKRAVRSRLGACAPWSSCRVRAPGRMRACCAFGAWSARLPKSRFIGTQAGRGTAEDDDEDEKKHQMTSTKRQTNSKRQAPMTQMGVPQSVLDLRFAVWDLFGFWDLRFGACTD